IRGGAGGEGGGGGRGGAGGCKIGRGVKRRAEPRIAGHSSQSPTGEVSLDPLRWGLIPYRAMIRSAAENRTTPSARLCGICPRSGKGIRLSAPLIWRDDHDARSCEELREGARSVIRPAPVFS